MPKHSVRSLAVIEALKTCNTEEELEAIAELMVDRILYVYHNNSEEQRKTAKHFAMMLLMDVQGKP